MHETEQWQMERHTTEKMAYYRKTYSNGSLRLLSGKIIEGARVIVYCEQGNGDTIFLLRYIPLLAKKCKVTVHCSEAMHRLILSQWNVDVLEKFNDDLPPHDYHILSMDLPLFFASINEPYIHIEETVAEVTHYQNPLGIAWEGNPDHPGNLVRACPLRYFKSLDGDLFCLQDQPYLESLQEGCEDLNLLGFPIADFYDTARLINSVKQVITVDTSILHLAGAMGKPTIGLLATPCDPRWGESLAHTPWYPSVKFIRQKAQGDWEGVFEQLRSEPVGR